MRHSRTVEIWYNSVALDRKGDIAMKKLLMITMATMGAGLLFAEGRFKDITDR